MMVGNVDDLETYYAIRSSVFTLEVKHSIKPQQGGLGSVNMRVGSTNMQGFGLF